MRHERNEKYFGSFHSFASSIIHSGSGTAEGWMGSFSNTTPKYWLIYPKTRSKLTGRAGSEIFSHPWPCQRDSLRSKFDVEIKNEILAIAPKLLRAFTKSPRTEETKTTKCNINLVNFLFLFFFYFYFETQKVENENLLLCSHFWCCSFLTCSFLWKNSGDYSVS